MTIAKFLQFMMDVVAASHKLGMENLVTVKFEIVGWKRRRLDVVVKI